MFTRSLLVVSLVLCFSSFANAAKGKRRRAVKNPQVLKFDGLNVNTRGGSPRDAFVSSKKRTDFGYFFDEKMSFDKKIKESLEAVR